MLFKITHPVSLAVLCLVVVLSGCGGSPPTAADSPPSPTASPTADPVSWGGLLVVDVVETGTRTNGSGPVQYDRAVVDRSPTLDDAITEAASTNATQRRDLSGRGVRRVEPVADGYNRSVSDLVVVKNGTVVRVSLAYEL